MTNRFGIENFVRPAYPHAVPLLKRPRPERTLTHLSILARALLGALLVSLTGGCGGRAGEGVGRRLNDGPSETTVALGVGALPGRPGYESMLRGLELAVIRLNEANGVRFRLRLPDSGSISAVGIAGQLRDDASVIGVVGHPESGNTLEAVPVYADVEHEGVNAVVAVSPTASSPRLSGISPWFFRVAPSDHDAARFVAQWVRDSMHASRAAIIYRNDAYGREWASTFGESFAERGAKVIERAPYLSGIMEWEAYARLIEAQRPDVVLFPGDAADALALLRALKARDVRVPFVGGDGTEGMQGAPEAEGAHFVAFFRPERATSAEGRRFLQQYRERYTADPDMFAALSYDAALAIGRTVQAGARSRLAVRAALEQLGRATPSVDGAAGVIAFDAKHDIAGRSVVVTTVRNGS